ncbi:MAG: thioredoxin domain-containing protein [Chloroflexota bacterium]
MADENFFKKLTDHPRPVVVDFWASWCGPCRAIEPDLKRLSKAYDGQVDLWRVNADDNPEVLNQLGVRGIPTLIAFRGGREILRHTGASSIEVLSGVFEGALKGAPLPSLLSPRDRLLRGLVGLAALLLAYSGNFAGWYLLAVALGVILLFTAVYDLNPLWQTLMSRLRRDHSHRD